MQLKINFRVKIFGVVAFLVSQVGEGYTTAIQSNIIVDTSNGPIRGSTALSREGQPFLQFLGIPYAKKPVRFELPEKPENWTGIKDAILYKPPCLHLDILFTGRINGNEDCLYLNVYTPYVNDEASDNKHLSKVPVIVFIHGGGFMSGNPRTYGGKYLMDENVILVTMAYRLGSFGFLSTGDEVIRGNMGLQDQVMALHWVQDNIAKFGGDPNQVTLVGESSGATAVHWHMLSPKSRGLFARAICQTGTALRRYPNTENQLGQAQSLAQRVGCMANLTSKDIAECLKRIDPLRIVETHRDATETLRSEYAIYGPIVEKVKDEKAFMTEEPYEILSSGNYDHVPMISGINSADGVLFAIGYVKDRVTAIKLDAMDGWATHLHKLLRYDDDMSIDKSMAVAQQIRKFYFGDRKSVV